MTNVAKFKENKMWDNIKNIIGASAPVLGTLIGGPAGTAVGTLISKTLGVDNTPEAIELALRNNPDALLRIKELETSKELAILEAELENKRIDVSSVIDNRKLDNEKDQMFLSDKQSARSRQVDSEKATGKVDVALYVIAGVIVVAFFVSILALIFITLDKQSGTYELLLMLFGALTTKFGTVVDYFFGASNK